MIHQSNSSPRDLALMASGFVVWGAFPVFFKQIDHVSPTEILAHRILWACVLLGLWFLSKKRFVKTIGLLKNRNIALKLFVASVFLSVNWLIFIYAVLQGQIIETSLGYYTTPLVFVFLGVVVLGERPTRNQYIALSIAVFSIVYTIFSVGYFPFMALSLAISFPIYGLIKKGIKLDSMESLFLETILMIPFGAILLWYTKAFMGGFYFGKDAITDFFLITSGALTLLPLIIFTKALERVPLYVSGFMQYIAPSITFLTALWIYNEPFDFHKMITFVLIWIALVFLVIDGIYKYRKARKKGNYA